MLNRWRCRSADVPVRSCESCAQACDGACRAQAGLDRLRSQLAAYTFSR